MRPKRSPTLRELTSYIYFRRNVAGVQREWWYHRLGCEIWFHAERDTRTNEVAPHGGLEPAQQEARTDAAPRPTRRETRPRPRR